MSTKKKKARKVHEIVFEDDDDDTEATLIQNFSYSDGGKSLEIDDHSSDSSDLEDIFSGIRKVPTYGDLEKRATSAIHKKKQPVKWPDSLKKSVFTPKTHRKPTETQRKDNGAQPKLMSFGDATGSSTSSRVTKPMSQFKHSQTKHLHTQHKASADTSVIDISSDEEPSPQRKRAKVYVQSTLHDRLSTKSRNPIEKTPIFDEGSTDSFEMMTPVKNKVNKRAVSQRKHITTDSSDSTIIGGNSPLPFKDDDEDSSSREAKRYGSWNFINSTSNVKKTAPNFDFSEESSSDLNDDIGGKNLPQNISTSDADRSWEPLRLSQNRKGVRCVGTDIIVCETDEDETQDPNAELDCDQTLVAESSPVKTSPQLHRKTERRKSKDLTPTPCQVPLREPIVYNPVDYNSDDSSSDGEWLIKPSQTHTPKLLTRGTPPVSQNPSQILKPLHEKAPLQHMNMKQSTLLESEKGYGRKSAASQKEAKPKAQNQTWKDSNSDKEDSDREGIFSYIRKLHQQSPRKPISQVLRKQVSESTSDEEYFTKENCAIFDEGKKTFPSSSPFNVPKSSSPNPTSVPLLAQRIDPFSFSEDTEADDDLPITDLLEGRPIKKQKEESFATFLQEKKTLPTTAPKSTTPNVMSASLSAQRKDPYSLSEDTEADDDLPITDLLNSRSKKQNKESFASFLPKSSTTNATTVPLLAQRKDPYSFSQDTEGDNDLPITDLLKGRSAKKRPASPVFGKSKRTKSVDTQDEKVGNKPLVAANQNIGERYQGSHGNRSVSMDDTKEDLLPNLCRPSERNRQSTCTNSGQESTSTSQTFTTKRRKFYDPPVEVDLTQDDDEETQDPNQLSDNEVEDSRQVAARIGLNEDSKEGLSSVTKETGNNEGGEDSKEGIPSFITKEHCNKNLNEGEDSKQGLLPFISNGAGEDKDLTESEDSKELILPFIKNESDDESQQYSKPGVSFTIKKEPADSDRHDAKADFCSAFTQADVYVIDSDDDGEDSSFTALSQSFVHFPIKEESEEEGEDEDMSEVIFVDPWNPDVINTSAMAGEQSAAPVSVKQEKEEEDLSQSLYLTQKAVQEAMNNWSDEETYMPDDALELTQMAADAGEVWSDCDDDLLLSLDIEPIKPSSPANVKTEAKPTPTVKTSEKVNRENDKTSTVAAAAKSDAAMCSPVRYKKIELSDDEGESTAKLDVKVEPQQADLLSRAKISNTGTVEKVPNNEAEMELTPEILTQILDESMEMDSQIVISDEEDRNKAPVSCDKNKEKDSCKVSKVEKSESAKENLPQSETMSDTISSVPSTHSAPPLKKQPCTFSFSVYPKDKKVEKSPEPFIDGITQVEYADDLTDEQLQAYMSAKYASASPETPLQSEHTKTQHQPIVISDDDKVDKQAPSISVKGKKSDHKDAAIDLTGEVDIITKDKEPKEFEKEGLKAQVTKDRESRQKQEEVHRSSDKHSSTKGARDAKPRSRSKSRSPVSSKERRKDDHKGSRKEDAHKSSSRSSSSKQADKKIDREKTVHVSSSSHSKDKKDQEKYKDTKSRSSSKVTEDIKRQSEKRPIGSSSSSKTDKDRPREKNSHSSTSKSSSSHKDDRRRDDGKSGHSNVSRDKKESSKTNERSSSSSRSSSHSSKTSHSRENKDHGSSSSTSRSKSKSPKPHSRHESSSRPKESERSKLLDSEKSSSSSSKNLVPPSKDASTSKQKESDISKVQSGEKPRMVTDTDSDDDKWISIRKIPAVMVQKSNKLPAKSTQSNTKDPKVSPSESSSISSAAVAKFQARMRGNHVPVHKPSPVSRSKKKTQTVTPYDDNMISMTQSIENAKVNMFERAQRAREERQKEKEAKAVTNTSTRDKTSVSSSSRDQSKSRSNKDNASTGTKEKSDNLKAKTQTERSKEDKNSKPSSSKHASSTDKQKASLSRPSTSTSSSTKKDSAVTKAIEDITESLRNLSQSQGQSEPRVETSKSAIVTAQHASSSTTPTTANVTTNSTTPKSSEMGGISTTSTSSTSAKTSATASTPSAVPPADETAVKKRRINLPVAATCSSTVPGTFQSVQQDPYELLKAMPALTIGDSGKNPTVDDFLNVVLQWIPKWMDEMDAQEGTAGPKPLPPFMNIAASGPSALLRSDTLWPVPDTFENVKEYFEIMLGHILHEVWSATYSDWRRSKNRPSMASFIPVSKDPNDNMFHTLVFQGLVVRNQQVPVSEGDLVIVHMKSVRRDGSPSGIQLVFGYVQRTEKTEPRNPQQLHPKLGNFQWVRNTKKMVLTLTIRFFYRILPDNEFMDIQVVTSLISVLRQIGGLIAFPRNPLSRDLLQPTRLKTFLPTEGREDKNLDKLYNSSQVRVINSVVASLLQPFVVPRVSLIQGPPGTGKSHTILAIIRNTIFRKTADGRTPCLMMCAPSNAAIDELVRRVSIENDIRKQQGSEMIRVVRIGSESSMSENSRQYSLDTKVKEAWENRKLLEKMKTMPMSIRKEMLEVHEQLPRLRAQLDAARKAKAAEQVRKLEQDIDMLEKKEAKFKDTGKRNEPTSRDKSQLRYEVLAHAHIVACTLNSAGSRIIADAVSFGQAQALNPTYKGPRFQFTGVLIDEACQCVEVEALIPLQYCATKLVLIGDPQQLPPTVISQDAETMKFSQSLFERLYNYFRMKSYSAVFLLDTQYRMHPEIAVFPSKHVYDGRLKTDPGLADKRSLFPFRHYFVFDLVYGREQSDQRSLSVSNPAEVEFVLSLVRYLTSTKVKPHLLGIITPYKKQKFLLQDQLRNCNLQQVDVGTVDGFQGQEKDVIIVSCVRACSSNNKIGFVADKRRMNVALTRAKYGCYVVGHLTSLRVDPDWGALVEDAVKRQVVLPVKNSSVRDVLIHKVCVKPVSKNSPPKNKGQPNRKS